MLALTMFSEIKEVGKFVFTLLCMCIVNLLRVFLRVVVQTIIESLRLSFLPLQPQERGEVRDVEELVGGSISFSTISSSPSDSMT